MNHVRMKSTICFSVDTNFHIERLVATNGLSGQHKPLLLPCNLIKPQSNIGNVGFGIYKAEYNC